MNKKLYIPVKIKFVVAFFLSILWAVFSYLIAQRWIFDLSNHIGIFHSHLIIFGIAVIPGFMNAFLIFGLLLDKRPVFKDITNYPSLSILVAAYNEQDVILKTIESIAAQNYPSEIEVVVVDDGSKDKTLDILKDAQSKYTFLKIINVEKNQGKANALNEGLKFAKYKHLVTIDADSYLYKDALINIVKRMLSDPPNTAAVAGTVLVRNSRQNLITKIQEWDYFHGIASIKRVQSLLQGTLVAQGAFSLYKTDVVRQVGGWPNCVGEDIVLTWSLLDLGYRIGYCEKAFAFTIVPSTIKQFANQRKRWARGMIEALKRHWKLLFKFRLNTIFIWLNLFFPYLDVVYTFVFVPGVILAFFGYYYIAGPMTLLVLPLAFIVNSIMYVVGKRTFKTLGLKVRKNYTGFLFYSLLYGLILQPACVLGYVSEVLNFRKTWGTK